MTVHGQGVGSVVGRASNTLLGLVAKRLVEHVGDLIENIGSDISLGLGVLKVDADVPVSQWEAGDTAVGAGTIQGSAEVDEINMFEPNLSRHGDRL